MSSAKKKETACRFTAGETVFIEVHVNHQVTVERAKILRLAPTWAVLKLGNRSITAFFEPASSGTGGWYKSSGRKMKNMNQVTGKSQITIQPPPDVPRYAWPAWVSCLQWAFGEPECRAAFEADTGFAYRAPRAPIEAMIDEAAGTADAYIEAFISWFNVKIWGAWDTPPEECKNA